MKKSTGLVLELIALYGLVPAVFLLDLSRTYRTAAILIAFLYVLVQCIRLGLFHRDTQKPDWRAILSLFGMFALVSTVVVAAMRPELLFGPPLRAPRIWLTFLFIYSVFSVIPQALVFRLFFLERYRQLFSDRRVLVLFGAVVFSWAHTIINHPLVYALTFVGGLLFARTYLRSRSLIDSAVEHALYGAWIFTLGLGTIFAFPI
ncbi:MAG: CPBP family intramembrane glutamic endopeptidase [Spirochaetia bacterium]